jgi:hypothetical protein
VPLARPEKRFFPFSPIMDTDIRCTLEKTEEEQCFRVPVKKNQKEENTEYKRREYRVQKKRIV